MSRTRKKTEKPQPPPAVLERDLERAAKRFKEFRGRDPHRGEIMFLRDRGTMALVVGELDGLLYRIDARQRARLHRFNRNSRPLLLVSADGKTAFIVKGRWTFNSRGFVG